MEKDTGWITMHESPPMYTPCETLPDKAIRGGEMTRTEPSKKTKTWKNPIKTLALSCLDAVAGWSVVIKVRLLMVLLVVLPCIAGLVILESESAGSMKAFLVIGLVAWIALLAPMSSIVAHLLVLRELKKIEAFCARLKAGDYETRFLLPAQGDEEHELLVLKRNLNWMAHGISRREAELQELLKKAREESTRHESMALMDPLTGLYNRRGLELKLTGLVREACVTDRSLTMMFLDVDKFKMVNDTLGHQAGDELLKSLGNLLRNNVREQVDIPFRFGGDELGVLFVGLDPDRTQVIGKRILEAYNTSRVGETALSIGIAGFAKTGRGNEADVQCLLASADQAAYEAKRQGGNRVCICRMCNGS